ncbi:MAG: DNA polymerase III subunit delta [Candidatus Omnitrophota bacterium]
MLYILCGENLFLKEQRIEEIKKDTLGNEAAVLNYEKYDGAEPEDFNSLMESIQSFSLFTKRLILFNRADKVNSQQLEKILLLAEKNLAASLILNSDRKDFSRQIPPQYKNKVSVFEKVYPEKIPAWLRQRARQKGVFMDEAALEVLARSGGGNLELLDSTLDVLIIFAGDKKRIEKEDVEKFTGVNLNENGFILAEAVGNRDVSKALKLAYGMLLSDYQSHQVLGILAWHFTRLLTAAALIKDYGRIEGWNRIQKALSLRGFVADKFMRQLSNFTFEQLKNSIKELLTADLNIKTLTVKPQYLLETTLIKLCGL